MDSVVVAFISFILMLSIGFELAHHHLKETTPEAFQPILTSLYSELTLLGFIGLLMFTIFKLEILEELSKHLFGEGEEIQSFLAFTSFLISAKRSCMWVNPAT